MKIDVTERVNKFREASRNLWNCHLRENADWNTTEAFDTICSELFREIVLRGLSASNNVISLGSEQASLENYYISSNGGAKLPVLANRTIPASGYWDHPTTWVPSEAKFRIKPLCFFDFDVLGWRDIEYIRVLIESCPTNPELEGREALVECRYATFQIEEDA